MRILLKFVLVTILFIPVLQKELEESEIPPLKAKNKKLQNVEKTRKRHSKEKPIMETVEESPSTPQKLEKNLKEDDKIENFNSCEITTSCKMCTYDQILNLEKCKKTGFIEILKCEEMEGIVKSCFKVIWVPKLYITCFFLWLFLLFFMSQLQQFKRKEEKRIVDKIVSGSG